MVPRHVFTGCWSQHYHKPVETCMLLYRENILLKGCWSFKWLKSALRSWNPKI
jgi:hypothetical protein